MNNLYILYCSFGLNQKNQKFKASESSAKMFARKPKILTIGSLTASPNHFVRFRLSAQTTEVFAAPSLHFNASLSGGRTSFAFLLLRSYYNIV